MSKWCFYQLRFPVGLQVSPQVLVSFFAVLRLGGIFDWRRLSCELWKHRGRLRFFVAWPASLDSILRSQIVAHQPRVDLIKVGIDWLRGWRGRVLDLVLQSDLAEGDWREFFDRIDESYSDPMVGMCQLLNELPDNSGWQLLIGKGKTTLRLFGRSKRVLQALAKASNCWLLEGESWRQKWRWLGWRQRWLRGGAKISPVRLATIYHLPYASGEIVGLDYAKVPQLDPGPSLLGGDFVLGSSRLGAVGVGESERRRHLYLVGKTGVGKSTMLLNLIRQDLQAGNGLAVIDPHGDLAESALNFVPKERINDVIYFDPADRDFPLAFNAMGLANGDPALLASGLIAVFKKLYAHSWGPRLEYILRNALLSVLALPGANLLNLALILVDADRRQGVMRKLRDPLLVNFWQNEFGVMPHKQQTETISPILNKLGQFLSNPTLRNLLGQRQSRIDLRFAMDKQKIILVNLAKGMIGEDAASLLGALWVSQLQMAAMSRADQPELDRRDFYLYVDEFQNFATESFGQILAEARKYRLNLILANQYLGQLPEELLAAILGNVGGLAAFQVGVDDTELLLQHLGSGLVDRDLLLLPRHHFYARLEVGGQPQAACLLKSLPCVVEPDSVRVAKIKRVSRERYNRSRDQVEKEIRLLLT